MTEEIINGIDVSECCFYNNGKCDNPNGMACNCINNAICYFKELKRLEQENKKLKKEIEKLKGVDGSVHPDSAYYKITRLEQENKELKEKVKSRENELANMAEQANMRINNYRSALEEIREYCNSEYGSVYVIIDKINEVLE